MSSHLARRSLNTHVNGVGTVSKKREGSQNYRCLLEAADRIGPLPYLIDM